MYVVNNSLFIDRARYEALGVGEFKLPLKEVQLLDLIVVFNNDVTFDLIKNRYGPETKNCPIELLDWFLEDYNECYNVEHEMDLKSNPYKPKDDDDLPF